MIPSAVLAKSPRVGSRGESAHDELQIAFESGEIGSGLIGKHVFVWHMHVMPEAANAMPPDHARFSVMTARHLG